MELYLILSSLGISRGDTDVYEALLRSGPSSAGVLSKILGAPRATLYDALSRLAEAGLVLVSLEDGVKTFIAEAPSRLGNLFARRIQELEIQRHSVEELVPTLNTLRSGKPIKPRFELFEGVEKVRFAMQDFLFHHDIESLNYWNVKMVDLLGMEHFFNSNRMRLERNISQKMIVSHSPSFSVKEYPFAGDGEFFLRETRLAPTAMKNPMAYWVYGDKVLFLSSRAEAYAYTVESEEMAKMMTEHFMAMWSISQPFKMKEGDDAPFRAYMERIRESYS
ncbi:helix-turn-helix domain-containing protein [bacterium]|nr:helix-turn-helix domain-containing protein [bacterium]